MEQEIRFCTARDGVRIAYATVGEGPPLVKKLSGQHPFLADAIADTIGNILRNDPPVVEKEGLPEGVAKVVNRCLAKSAEDRFESANELAEELRAIGNEEPS